VAAPEEAAASCRSEIGMITTCSGANQNGNAPA
jgi:hypothetical protein